MASVRRSHGDSAASAHVRRRTSRRVLLVASVLFWLSQPGVAPADEIQIGKVVVDGRIVREGRLVLDIETVSGVLAVPVACIVRRVAKATRQERYEEEVARQPLTAERHRALAEWCRSQRLVELEQTHIRAALKLNPTDEDLLTMAGYVRVGDVWLDAGLDKPTLDARPQDAGVVDRLVSAWHPLIRKIRDDHFGPHATAEQVATGRLKLHSARTGLAVPAACRVLGDGTESARHALVGLLGGTEGDAATLNLVIVSLLDSTQAVRDAAGVALLDRRDARVVQAWLTALRCSSHTVLRRAVEALGHCTDELVVENLLAVLPTGAFASPPLRPRDLPGELSKLFTQPTLVPIDRPVYEHPTTIAFPALVRPLEALAANDAPELGQFRSYVQDAMTTITGADYGFDVAAWREWSARRRSLPASVP